MQVKIGVADSSKLVELEVDDEAKFRETVEEAVKDGGIAWFTDEKGRQVGIPTGRIAYVEIDSPDGGRAVGFGPAV
jgi:hypothetical protein